MANPRTRRVAISVGEESGRRRVRPSGLAPVTLITKVSRGKYGEGTHRRKAQMGLDSAIFAITEGRFGCHEHRLAANRRAAELTHGFIGQHRHRNQIHHLVNDESAAEAAQLAMQEVCDEAVKEEHIANMSDAVLKSSISLQRYCGLLAEEGNPGIFVLRNMLELHFAHRCGNKTNRAKIIENLLDGLSTGIIDSKVHACADTGLPVLIDRVRRATWIDPPAEHHGYAAAAQKQMAGDPENGAEVALTGSTTHSDFIITLALKLAQLDEEVSDREHTVALGDLRECIERHFARWMVPLEYATLMKAIEPYALPLGSGLLELNPEARISLNAAATSVVRLINSPTWRERRFQWAHRHEIASNAAASEMSSIAAFSGWGGGRGRQDEGAVCCTEGCAAS